jgi:Fe2+ transport system protein FeoA
MVTLVSESAVPLPGVPPLNVGASGVVEGFTTAEYAAHLMAMGVLPGSRIRLVRKAPFGGAVYVEVDQQYIALRDLEFSAIAIRP